MNAVVVDTDGYVLRMRERPGLDAPIVTLIPPGATVRVIAGPQADSTGAPWFNISYGGAQGWVLGEHLAPSTAPLSAPAAQPSSPPPPPPSAPPAPSPTPKPSVAPAPASAARGQAIVDDAMRYLGVPYVYGGASPSGWDCSGFVLYVYNEAAGITLPRSAAQQYRVGAEIPANQVQAGDIVFFADTFGPGITHNGIANGAGGFIHARSEGYGTVVSSLSDPYWAQHYAGARRP
jgi:cell wall-associated NlpC family hydrolase